VVEARSALSVKSLILASHKITNDAIHGRSERGTKNGTKGLASISNYHSRSGSLSYQYAHGFRDDEVIARF